MVVGGHWGYGGRGEDDHCQLISNTGRCCCGLYLCGFNVVDIIPCVCVMGGCCIVLFSVAVCCCCFYVAVIGCFFVCGNPGRQKSHYVPRLCTCKEKM